MGRDIVTGLLVVSTLVFVVGAIFALAFGLL
jgi:hypothetical protein